MILRFYFITSVAITAGIIAPNLTENEFSPRSENQFQDFKKHAPLKLSMDDTHTLPEHLEIFIPEPPEPPVFFEEPERVFTPVEVTGDPVVIRDHRCGCAPAPMDLIVAVEYPEDIPLEESESLLPEPILNNEPFTSRAYPNPTIGNTTVELEIPVDGYYQINTYNINGALIQSNFEGQLYSGRQTFNLDLTEYSTGIYFCTITTENQQETIKIQKN